MRFNPFATAAALAMVLALGLALRVFSQNSGFRHEVIQSLATTEGYDQKFIDMVNNLEDVLTVRASFSYPGGKDPMSGRRREVVSHAPAAVPRRSAASAAPAMSAKPSKAESDTATLPAPHASPADLVKLTAIIADDYGQHTAIVMNGERSMSVDIGDLVGSRKITRITSKEVTMEDDTAIYGYDIAGKKSYQRK